MQTRGSQNFPRRKRRNASRVLEELAAQTAKQVILQKIREKEKKL